MLGVSGADRHYFVGLAEYAVLPAPVAPAIEGIEWPQPQRQTVVTGGAVDGFDVVFTEHERQPARLQGFFEGLEAVAVFDLDDVPWLFQQLLEAVAQVRRQAVDAGAHRVAGVDRRQQVQRAVQGAPGKHDQAFEQGLQRLSRGLAGGDFRLHQQGDAMTALRQVAQQVILSGFTAAGGRPGQVG
ncbi:hypothetical protein D3C76_1366580 [compost metagenome]